MRVLALQKVKQKLKSHLIIFVRWFHCNLENVALFLRQNVYRHEGVIIDSRQRMLRIQTNNESRNKKNAHKVDERALVLWQLKLFVSVFTIECVAMDEIVSCVPWCSPLRMNNEKERQLLAIHYYGNVKFGRFTLSEKLYNKTSTICHHFGKILESSAYRRVQCSR